MSVLSTVQYISLIVHIAFTRAVRPMGIVLEHLFLPSKSYHFSVFCMYRLTSE